MTGQFAAPHLEVTVNIGVITSTYETHVQYGTEDSTRLRLTLVTADAVSS